ncbi:hypothetical protein [Streptomyces sp. NPDC088196]
MRRRSGFRPVRKHDTTCAKAAAEDMPARTDLGYGGLAGSALRIPAEKVK